MHRHFLYFMVALLAAAPKLSAQTYRDPKAPIDARVSDLLSRMTLEEKVGQLLMAMIFHPTDFDAHGNFVGPSDRPYVREPVGHTFQRFDPAAAPRSIEAHVALTNAVQKYLIEHNRLGIPAIWIAEGLHGFMWNGATSFPQVIALASTWDPALVEAVFSAAALEGRSRGAHLYLNPVLDLARDPRWGRTEETFSEDPYLVARMGLAVVRGLQGRGATIDADHVVSTIKHFAGGAQAEGGKNKGPVNISERLFRETHLYPYEIAVKQGKARCLMAAYNEWDEVPCHINKHLLTDILRTEWGFDGCITSDGSGVWLLVDMDHITKNYAEAARWALEAGIDVELAEGEMCYENLVGEVRAGNIAESMIDRSVRHVLRMKFELGLFEQPFVDAARCVAVTNNADHRALALKAAHEAIILLKNEGPTLPFDAKNIKKLAVIGPNAAGIHLGEYSPVPMVGVSVLEGLQEFAARNGFEVRYAEGCKITANKECYWTLQEPAVLNSPEADQRLIDGAVAVARECDAVLLVLGGNEITARESWSDQHVGERDDLGLVGRQNDLARAVIATGKPLAVLLLNGRPLTVNELQASAPAILEGWYLGQETGRAVADVLFGKVNPSGKMPVSIARSVGQLPCYYNKRPSQAYYKTYYSMVDNTPLYPFGHGLSYTTFAYGKMRLAKPTIAVGESVDVSIDITNTAAMAGDEVVQLYVHDKIGSLPRPIMELKDFTRVNLAPGETKTVTFTITPEKLEFFNIHMKRVVEPGEFEIMIGRSSADYLTRILTVVP